jgi:hypothetical protein
VYRRELGESSAHLDRIWRSRTSRKKLYRTLDELQADLAGWLREYNEQREHSGKYCYGKTPMQNFLDSKHLAHEKMLDELTTAAPSHTAQRRAEPERSHAGAGGARVTAA